MNTIQLPPGPQRYDILLEYLPDNLFQRSRILAPSHLTATLTVRELARNADRGLSGVEYGSYDSFTNNLFRRTHPDSETDDSPLSTRVENILRAHPDKIMETAAYDKEEIPVSGLSSAVANTLGDLYRSGPYGNEFGELPEGDDSIVLELLQFVHNKIMDENDLVRPERLSARLVAKTKGNDLLEVQPERHFLALYVDELHPAQERLLDHLEEGRATVYREQRLKPGGETSPDSPDDLTNLEVVQKYLFTGDAPERNFFSDSDEGDGEPADDTLTFYSTPDLDHEIETLVSHLLADVVNEEDSVPFPEVGIIAPNTDDLLRYVEELRGHDVPVYVAGGLSLLSTNVGKAFRSLLRVFRDRAQRDRVMDFLKNPTVDLSPLREKAEEVVEELGITEEDLDERESIEEYVDYLISRHRWDRYSRNADVDRGVQSGDDEDEQIPDAPFAYPSSWRNQLDVYESEAYRSRGKSYLKTAVSGDEFDPKTKARRLAFVRSVRKFLDDLEAVYKQDGVEAQLHRLTNLFETYLKTDADHDPPFGSVFEPEDRFKTSIRNRLLDGIDNRVERVDWNGYEDLNNALDALEKGVNQTLGMGERLDEGGVFLATPEAARGKTFRKLLVAGLNERTYPSVTREDPFLKDDLRAAANVEPLSSRRKQRQKSAFHELISGVGGKEGKEPELVLSYRRMSSEGGGTIRMPSTFYVSAYDLFSDAAWSDFEEAVGAEQEEYPVTPVSITGNEQDFVPLTPAEAGLREVHQRLEEAQDGETVSVPDLSTVSENSAFARAIVQDREQFGDEWTPASGIFEDDDLGEQIAYRYFGAEPDKGRVSSSRFGKFYDCPRKFLFEEVLNFTEEGDRPEEKEELDHMERGSFVHEVLEFVFRTFEDRNIHTTTTSEKELRDIARDVFEEIRDRYYLTHHGGPPFLWKQNTEDYWEMVDKVLDEYLNDDWVPFEYEYAGYEGPRRYLDECLSQEFKELEKSCYERKNLERKFLQAVGGRAARPEKPISNEVFGECTPAEVRSDFETFVDENAEDLTAKPAVVHEGEEYELKFGGFIDRIDEGKGDLSGQIRLVDYKTGKDEKYKDNRILSLTTNDDNERQKHQLQLPVYGLLVQENFDRNLREAVYMFLSEKADDRIKSLNFSPAVWEEVLKPAFEKSIRQMYRTIRNGEFPSHPRCSYCSCDTICGTTSQRKAVYGNKDENKLVYGEFLEAATAAPEDKQEEQS